MDLEWRNTNRRPRSPGSIHNDSYRSPATGDAYEPIHANPIPYNHLLGRIMRNGSVEVCVRQPQIFGGSDMMRNG